MGCNSSKIDNQILAYHNNTKEKDFDGQCVISLRHPEPKRRCALRIHLSPGLCHLLNPVCKKNSSLKRSQQTRRPSLEQKLMGSINEIEETGDCLLQVSLRSDFFSPK
mmetsp:Transcript_17620/g.36229  ORF Transcript_17620/g.36229 Transcript_17620/m.36229 type:complete len:108 (+) Transcript_17620:119-442(+)